MTRYDLLFNTVGSSRLLPQDAYCLYAALLENVSPNDGDYLHTNSFSPISTYLEITPGGAVWHIGLLNEWGENLFSPVIEYSDEFYLAARKLTLSVTDVKKQHLTGADALLRRAETLAFPMNVRFLSPTAFKSDGRYINFPDMEFILKSLTHRWNGTFPECPIDDEDGEGISAMAQGLCFHEYSLCSVKYRLKGACIPAFTGWIQLSSRLTGFHETLAKALLLFGNYSGVGIKTTLGMGGIQVYKH